MNGWQREGWASAKINARLNDLDAELRSIVRDEGLNYFQKSVLMYAAIDSAAFDLCRFEKFGVVAS